MLDILRNRAQSTLIQALVIIIALVFIFWGVGTNLGNRKNIVAKVNGAEISLLEFQQLYDRTLDNYRQQFGGQIPDGLLESLDIKGQVLGQLIQAELFRQGGTEMGLSVSKQETQDEIKKMPVFQENGQFNMDRYKAVLSQNRMAPSSFESGLSSDLLTRRTADAVERFAVLTTSETKAWQQVQNEEIQLAYLPFTSEDFTDKVVIEDAALAAWFESHREEYRSEPAIKLDYLFFDFNDDLASITVDDNAIKAKYEADKAKYEQPEQRHARHILFKLTEDADEKTRQEKQKKAETVLAEAKKGADFAELAKLHSEGPTKDNGGDLGFFPRGRMVPSFDQAVFSMKEGEVSGIVESPFGLHIIKLEKIRPGKTQNLEEVRDTIATELQKQQVKGVTFKRAGTAYEDIMRAGSVAAYGDEHKDIVQHSDLFTRSAPPAGPLASPALLNKAFSLKQGELSSIIELEKGYAIIYVNTVQTPELPALETVRDRVEKDYIQEQAVSLAKEAANQLLQNAAKEKELALAAKEKGFELQTSGYKKRTPSAAQANDGLPPQLVELAFSLPWSKKLPDEIFTSGTTFIVYEIADRRQGEESTDANQQEQLAAQLQNANQNRLVSNWLASLREQAEIWTNNDLLN